VKTVGGLPSCLSLLTVRTCPHNLPCVWFRPRLLRLAKSFGVTSFSIFSVSTRYHLAVMGTSSSATLPGKRYEESSNLNSTDKAEYQRKSNLNLFLALLKDRKFLCRFRDHSARLVGEIPSLPASGCGAEITLDRPTYGLLGLNARLRQSSSAEDGQVEPWGCNSVYSKQASRQPCRCDLLLSA
jgi:hypothetical protein